MMTTLDTQLRRDNLRTWLENELVKNHGTPNQLERWVHRLLPEEELRELARDELFPAELQRYRRWSGREREALAKAVEAGCRRRDLVHSGCVDFEVAAIGELEAEEWSVLGEIRDLVELMRQHPWLQYGGKVEIDESAHWATCKVCSAESFAPVVTVTILWAERTLVREYMLQRKPVTKAGE